VCAVVAASALPGDVLAQETEESGAVQPLPDGLLYRTYLAGEKEPGFSGAVLFGARGATYLDAVLGGRLGLLRYDPTDAGSGWVWQLDFEAAAYPRLNLDQIKNSFVSTDFRVGSPLTLRGGRVALKLGYYHVSSHVGDEFLALNPEFIRINYVRDSFLAAVAYHLSTALRTYVEAGYAFYGSGGAEPWELQFGAEYRPALEGREYGSPYLAVHGHLREEFDFGGSVNAAAGWELSGPLSDRRMRLGVRYFRGKTSQYSFFDEHEELFGLTLGFEL
jgi:hypothetical protein